MRKLLGLLLILFIMIPAIPVSAQDEDAPCTGVFLIDGRIRSSVSPTAAAYGLVVNLTTDTVTVTGGSAEGVEAIEIHTMTVGDDDVMVMRPLEDGLEIPTGHAAELRPGGLHVMMIGLGDMLMAGEEFPLSLSFEDGSEFALTLPIVDIEATTDHEGDSEHNTDSDHENDAEHGDSEHSGDGEHDTDSEHGHDHMTAKPVTAMTECEGLTGVIVSPNAEMDIVYDLTFIFEDGTEWSVSVPVIGLDGMDMEMETETHTGSHS